MGVLQWWKIYSRRLLAPSGVLRRAVMGLSIAIIEVQQRRYVV